MLWPMLFQDPILLVMLELLLLIVLKLNFNFAVDLKLIIRYFLMLANYLLVGFTHFDYSVVKQAISFII